MILICQPSIISPQFSVFSHQSSILSFRPSTINHQPPATSHQPHHQVSYHQTYTTSTSVRTTCFIPTIHLSFAISQHQTNLTAQPMQSSVLFTDSPINFPINSVHFSNKSSILLLYIFHPSLSISIDNFFNSQKFVHTTLFINYIPSNLSP